MEQPINNHTEIWKIKTYIRHLEIHRGKEASLVSLLIPRKTEIPEVCKWLNTEIDRVSKISEDKERVHLLDALRIAQRLVNAYDRAPPNGVAIFTGTSLKTEDEESRIKICIEPSVPILEYFYDCDKKFHTEKLENLLRDDENLKYGFIVVGFQDALFGTLQGTDRQIVHEFHFKQPFGFFTKRTDSFNRFAGKVAERAARVFITGDKTNVDGLILASSDLFKRNLCALLDSRLREKIERVVHYEGHDTILGFSSAIKQAADVLADVRYVQEDLLIQRLFNEVVNSTKRFCFGLEDTIKFLHAGVIDTLLCWENFDISRVVVQNPVTEVISTLFLTPEQNRDRSLFKSQNEEEADLEVVDAQLLVLWLAVNYRRLGFNLEIITGKSILGEKFIKTLSGFGAILCVKRRDLGEVTSSDASDFEA